MSITDRPQYVRTTTAGTTAVPEQPLAPPVAEQRVLPADAVPVMTTERPLGTEVVRTEHTRRWAIDSIITGLVGLAMLAVGLVALARAGVDRPLNRPVVDVLGFNHTAWLAIAEIGAGVLLLLAAAARSRFMAVLFGVLIAVAGVIAAVQTSSFDNRFGIESDWAWILAAAGAVVALASLLIPRPTSTRSTVRTDVDRY